VLKPAGASFGKRQGEKRAPSTSYAGKGAQGKWECKRARTPGETKAATFPSFEKRKNGLGFIWNVMGGGGVAGWTRFVGKEQRVKGKAPIFSLLDSYCGEGGSLKSPLI